MAVATNDARSILALVSIRTAFSDSFLREMKALLGEIHRSAARPVLRLTAGEAEALRLLAGGSHICQAAYQLGISESAMKLRLASARKRLGVRTTVAAIHAAGAHGLI